MKAFGMYKQCPVCKEQSLFIASLVDLNKCHNDIDFLNKIAYIVDGTCENCGYLATDTEELERLLIGDEGMQNAREDR
jgi:C4-type Zn-finger protein